MNAEERARDIGYCTCHNASDSLAGKHDEYCIFTRVAAAIRAAERAATLAEREACALVCEGMANDTRKRFEGHKMPVDVIALDEAAAAIRARAEGGA